MSRQYDVVATAAKRDTTILKSKQNVWFSTKYPFEKEDIK